MDLWLLVLQDPKAKRPEEVLLTVLDTQSLDQFAGEVAVAGRGDAGGMAAAAGDADPKAALAFFAPRGVEPSKWLSEPEESEPSPPPFMLLGQTLDGMWVWDIRCAAQAVTALPEFKNTPLYVRARGPMAVNVAYAALFQPEIAKLEAGHVPASQAEGPDYLNVLKVWDLPQLWSALGERAGVENP